MRKLLLFCLSILLIAPAVAKATNAQAQEYDDLGSALYRQGLYAKSIPYFQNAVQADPTDWQGYENLGNAYFKINANPDALSAYQKSLQINPNNSTLENIVQTLQASATPLAVNTNPAVITSNSPANTQPMNGNPPPAAAPANNQPGINQPPTGSAPPTAPQSGVDSDQPIQNGQSNPSQDYAPSQPGTTVVVQHRRHWRSYDAQPEPTYTDNLAPIDHAKFWAKLEGGYSYTTQGDLMNSASVINSENSAGTLPNNQLGLTSGSASMSPNAYNVGAELGFLLNPSNGIAIGLRFIQSTDYIFNGINSAAATVGSNPNDFENADFSAYVIPITLDYYVFLPDHDGRFFISAGVGYYAADVHVNEQYNFDNYYGQTHNYNTPFGDLTAGGVGFQVSIGREFEITRRLGFEIFARGRYARITNFQGTLSDGNAYALQKFSDGSVDISNIAAGGQANATVDFTGFDAGIAFNWYSF